MPRPYDRLAVLGVLLAASVGPAQQVQRDGFGGRTTMWQRGLSDTKYEEREHRLTDDFKRSLPTSEVFTIDAELGTSTAPYVQYLYPTRKAPISDDFGAGVFVRATRQGVQLLARVVLPRARHPDRPEEAMTVLIKGDSYSYTERWQRLEVTHAPKLLKEELQLLRARYSRDFELTDAYVDQLVLNVYAGPGRISVWTDDLEIGPVLEDPTATPKVEPPAKATPAEPVARPKQPRASLVELTREQLLVGGQRFWIRGIRWTDADLRMLREAGFNTVFLDAEADPRVWDEAAGNNFMIVPMVSVPGLDRRGVPGRTVSRPRNGDPEDENDDAIGKLVSRTRNGDAVLFWYLGGDRMAEHVGAVSRTAQAIRENDPQRPIGADVWDGLWPYSRNVDLVGVHRFPLLTGMELTQYRDWLNQRRLLTRGAFTWTWVQTHLPDWFTQIAYEKPSEAAFEDPIGPQPEQVRLLTYVAMASGVRGLGFWSDRFLADSHQGRDRLLTMALLNQELDLMEPMLLSQIDAPAWIDTSNPNVKAAVTRCERGLVVVPMWIGGGAQFVPGQSATQSLTLTVPMPPDGTQPWEVTPGEVRSLKPKRVNGGVELTLQEFGLTTCIVFTGDNGADGLLVKWQKQQRNMARLAAQWSYDLAVTEYEKVRTIQEKLEKVAPPVPGARDLMMDSNKRLQETRLHFSNGDFRSSYLEAQRAMRPLRILMRLQWNQAVRGMISPVASPYAVSYYTLPKHWEFWESVRKASAGTNGIAGGQFEVPVDQTGWAVQRTTLDDVDLAARVTDQHPHEGRGCLELKVSPRLGTPDQPLKAPAALERTFLAASSPAAHFPPGTLVRISGWVKIPQPIAASADGVLVYDSIGGEPLALRTTAAVKEWRQFALYRRVPASGQVFVTAAMTGLGTVYLDDVRIEPLLPGGATVLQP